MSSLRAQSNATGGGDKPLLCDDSTQALLVTFPAGGAGTSDSTEATQLLVKTAVEAINTETGSLTETAPATDTASSGINGRLQRVAQHLTNVVSYTSRLLSSAGPKAAGSALATTAFQVGGTYNSALPTMTNTQEAGLQLNVNGRILASNVLEAGSAIAGKVGIDQTTPGTTDSVTLKSAAHSATVTITRPGTTPAYASGVVIGDTNGSAIFTFANMARAAGDVIITSIELEIDVAAVPSGMSGFNVRLYNASPTAIADNAAWDLPSGDRGKYLGKVLLGTPVDEGSTLFSDNDTINKQITLIGTALYVELQSVGAFTPSSASIKRLTIHTLDV